MSAQSLNPKAYAAGERLGIEAAETTREVLGGVFIAIGNAALRVTAVILPQGLDGNNVRLRRDENEY